MTSPEFRAIRDSLVLSQAEIGRIMGMLQGIDAYNDHMGY